MPFEPCGEHDTWGRRQGRRATTLVGMADALDDSGDARRRWHTQWRGEGGRRSSRLGMTMLPN
jgi:hypothetical protein